LEFLPFANGNLLTLLSVWWPFGQLLGSLIAWGFLPNYSCTDSAGASLPSCGSVADGIACCTKDSNMGWRYLNYTMGAFTFFMFICRFFLFHLFESPKFLLSKGRQREAVASVYGIAYHNKAKTWLSEDILDEIGGKVEPGEKQGLSTVEVIKRQAEKFSTQRIKPLFGYKRLGINTGLLWFMWTTIGMGYPLFNAFLPQYLSAAGGESKSVSETYRDYAITSIVGCPGSIIACLTVDIKYVGRKGTMAIATLLTGIFLFLFTQSATSSYQLAFSCLVALFQNVMYGVLYGEIIPRGARLLQLTNSSVYARNVPSTESRYRYGYCECVEPHCRVVRATYWYLWRAQRSEGADLCVWRLDAGCVLRYGVSTDRDKGKADAIDLNSTYNSMIIHASQSHSLPTSGLNAQNLLASLVGRKD
jgi:hypothetical protein